MKKKIMLLCSSILLGALILSGCSNSEKKENERLTNEVKVLSKSNVNLQKEVVELKKELKKELEKSKKQEAITTSSENEKSTLFNIYTANIDTYKKEVLVQVSIKNNLPLKEKLQIIADNLSKSEFDNLPIEVLKVAKVNDKTVAVVNLKEALENQNITDVSKFKGKSWATGFFQGSTGGTITTTSLTESLLQKDYNGEWIDGIHFLYNGANCDYEHVGLSDIIYRK